VIRLAVAAFWGLALIAALAGSPPLAHAAMPAATATPSDIEKRLAFEDVLEDAVSTGDFVGLAVAVARNGETSFLRTYGVAEAGAPEPITPRTVFRVASLSKGFAASLAGLAEIESRLSTNEGAALYAPGFKLKGGAEKSMTLGHVLSHRTGLPPNAYDNLLEDGVPLDTILPKYKDVPLTCAVGACYGYQNIAFDIIGRALATVYGRPYDELVAEKLFAPLGMTTASIGEAGLKASGSYARPHVRDRIGKGSDAYGPWRAVDVKDAYYKVPAAGGVNASILDMAEWLKAQMGARPDILPRETLALIHAPRVATPSELARIKPVSTRYRETSYGYGWRIYHYEGRRLITHSGTVDGYSAQIAFLPEEDVGIVILANGRARRVWRILPTFLDIELGLPREDWLALEDVSGEAMKAGSR
jgi:beta-lactamase class C